MVSSHKSWTTPSMSPNSNRQRSAPALVLFFWCVFMKRRPSHPAQLPLPRQPPQHQTRCHVAAKRPAFPPRRFGVGARGWGSQAALEALFPATAAPQVIAGEEEVSLAPHWQGTVVQLRLPPFPECDLYFLRVEVAVTAAEVWASAICCFLAVRVNVEPLFCAHLCTCQICIPEWALALLSTERVLNHSLSGPQASFFAVRAGTMQCHVCCVVNILGSSSAMVESIIQPVQNQPVAASHNIDFRKFAG